MMQPHTPSAFRWRWCAASARGQSARVLAAIAVAAGAAAVMAACGGSTCPFQLVQRYSAEGTVTGAFATRDLAVGSQSGLEIDLSSTQINGQANRVDLWLTAPDCQRLFDGPYPLASGAPPPPLCRVILGPVAPGTVSSRVKADAGTFRVFVQAFTANDGPANYIADIGAWGNSCRGILLQ